MSYEVPKTVTYLYLTKEYKITHAQTGGKFYQDRTNLYVRSLSILGWAVFSSDPEVFLVIINMLEHRGMILISFWHAQQFRNWKAETLDLKNSPR